MKVPPASAFIGNLASFPIERKENERLLLTSVTGSICPPERKLQLHLLGFATELFS